ncbi:MAG: beta-agarase [Bacteroidota bacterium]
MKNLLLLTLSISFLLSCDTTSKLGNTTSFTPDPLWKGQEQLVLFDFEGQELPQGLAFTDAEGILSTDKGVSQGKQALKVDFKGDEKNPGLVLKPSTPIDASQFNDFCLVFDATNITEGYSTQVFLAVENTKGHRIRRAAVIPVGETKTCYFELSGKYVNMDTGLRDDPDPWNSSSLRMNIMGLKEAIDFSEISAIYLNLSHPIADKSLIIDNIRLVESPRISDDYLVKIVDKYGQSAKDEFEGKISSDEQLKAAAEKELKQLEEGTMAGRSAFGGWENGPKFEATGYFRTEKLEKTWAMVDPDGYLFFSTGIANVRMANTTSFTGIDFKNDQVRYRDPEDVTPEDSRGMVNLTEDITSTAYIAYPMRNAMFEELPAYDDDLANHYSYRREQHIGPFEHGETYSFYQANLERRYGEEYPGAHLDKWVDVTLDRFLNWGFTSFGNWAEVDFYDKNRMPYFADGWIIGDFKTVRSGFDYWGPMPDVFDPEFARRVKVTVSTVAKKVNGSPWCIGVFVDNEKSWGIPGTPKGQYGIVLDALSMNASQHPIKATFSDMLKEKYTKLQALNAAWEVNIDSWSSFDKGADYKDKEDYNSAMLADFSVLLEAYASRYFQTVHDELEKELPNHLYMGCRFASWGMGPEVRKAALKYVDVFSYNYYQEAVGNKYWTFLEEIDRPSIIGEFHMGTMESGLFHPGLVHASDQQDRARMYTKYMETVIDNPYFVGAHWFQYIDSPVSGRAHDGENYNVGFVTNTDIPYKPMVEAAKTLNRELYNRKYAKSVSEN